VLSVEDGEPCRVETERGTVTANAVVVASHVPVVNKVFLHTKLEPMRSYLMAVSTGQPHPEGLFWDLASPYHYWRNVHLDGQDLLLVGGGDHKVGEIEDTEGAFRELEAYVRERLGRANVSARWSGQIIEPVDGLAYVGRNSMSTHVFVATGYSGNGLTGATAAAMILCDEVDGSAHPWSDLFAATRVKPVAGRGMLLIAQRTWWLTSRQWSVASAERVTVSPEPKACPSWGVITVIEGEDRTLARSSTGSDGGSRGSSVVAVPLSGRTNWP
jgi:glycine/D-amino acid oxidase-like deaminating enzyme